jgi:hypothetical protein
MLLQNGRVIGQMITGGGNGVEWSFIFVTVCLLLKTL